MAGFGSSSLGQMPLPKLTKSNYDNWSIQIKALLGAQGTWEVVQDGFPDAVNTEGMTVANLKALKENRMKDKTALYTLYQGVDEAGFEKIAEAKTSKEAWEILQNAYKGAERVKQVRLQTLQRRTGVNADEGIRGCLGVHHTGTGGSKSTQEEWREISRIQDSRKDPEII